MRVLYWVCEAKKAKRQFKGQINTQIDNKLAVKLLCCGNKAQIATRPDNLTHGLQVIIKQCSWTVREISILKLHSIVKLYCNVELSEMMLVDLEGSRSSSKIKKITSLARVVNKLWSPWLDVASSFFVCSVCSFLLNLQHIVQLFCIV